MEIKEAFDKLAKSAIVTDGDGYECWGRYCRYCSVAQNDNKPMHADDCPVSLVDWFIQGALLARGKVA